MSAIDEEAPPIQWSIDGIIPDPNWQTNVPGGSATVTGRTRKNILLKFFPLWWFYNSDEPIPPAWYEPGKSQWLRVFYWYCRNPLYNFGKYVIGCKDINYTVTGTSPVLVNLMADIGQTGWKHSFIWLYGFIPLPFVSYSGDFVFYAGWMPKGMFGLKLTKH